MGDDSKRRRCTKENPMTPERDSTEPGWGWYHEGLFEVGEPEDNWPCGDIQRYECPNCGISFKAELPQ